MKTFYLMRQKLLLCLLIFLWMGLANGQSTLLSVDPGTPSTFINRPNSYIGTEFQRQLTIRNSSNSNFTGFIRINETNGSALSSVIAIQRNLPLANVVLVQPAGKESEIFGTGYTLTPSVDNEIVLRVSDFAFNSIQHLLLTEDISAVSCLSAGYSSSVAVSLYQTSSTTPPAAQDYVAIQGGVYNQDVIKGSMPQYEFFDWQQDYANTNTGPMLDPQDFICVSNSNFRTMSFSMRRKSEPAFEDATFRDCVLKFENDGVTFTVDRLSIVIEKFSSVNPSTPIQTWNVNDQQPTSGKDANAHISRINDPTSTSCLSVNRKFSFLEYHIGNIGPDEFIRVTYDLYNCCKDVDLFDKPYAQHNRIVHMTFKDDCGTAAPELVHMGPSAPYAAQGLYLEPDIYSAPAIMNGASLHQSYPDVGNFIIDNPLTPNSLVYSGVYGGPPVIFDPFTAEVIVRIRSGASLRYTAYEQNGSVITTLAGTYDHQTNPGGTRFKYFPSIRFIDRTNSSLQWHPLNATGVATALPNSYELREFRFSLMDLPGITGSSTEDEIRTALFNVLEDYRLSFSMEGICGEDGNWKVEYLFSTGNSCSECIQPLASVSETVQVNCPGCIVPGGAAGGNVYRTIFGPYDVDNDGLPDAGETETSTHTFQQVSAYNFSDNNPSNDVMTSFASVGDQVTFAGSVYLTAPSDCQASNACRDNELLYKWAYMQIHVPNKNYMAGNFTNLQVQFKRGTFSYTIPGSSVETHFYEGPVKDIYYMKIHITDISGYSSSEFFRSGDQLEFLFSDAVAFNVSQRKQIRIAYNGYFTKAEEVFSTLQTSRPDDLYNRSFAACTTIEQRGIDPTCDTEDLQMICENGAAFLVLVPVSTKFNHMWYSEWTRDKSCNKFYKKNAPGNYGGEKSNYGNPFSEGGVNVYQNEIRIAPLLESFHLVLPVGYSLEEFRIWTSIMPNRIGPGQDQLIITHNNLSSANQVINSQIGSNREMDIDLSQLYSIADGVPNPARPLRYTDESFQNEAFQIRLRPNCDTLISKSILQTDISKVIIGGVPKVSYFQVNNPFIGNNGRIDYGDVNSTEYFKTPVYASNPFILEKEGAQGNKFRTQHSQNFVNEFNVVLNFPSGSTNLYRGEMFFAIDPSELVKYFDEFKLYSGTSLILDWSAAPGHTNTLVAMVPDVPTDLKVTGIINMSDPNIPCNAMDKALYDLFYGIHCNSSEITHANIINNNVCNRWTEHIELDLDWVDYQTSLSTVSVQNKIVTQEAIFTANRSQLIGMFVEIENAQNLPVTIESVFLKRGTTGQTVPLTAANFQITNSGNITTVNVNDLITNTPAGTIFEVATDGEEYYNELHIQFETVFEECSLTEVNTSLEASGIPFYSRTRCAIARSASNVVDLTPGEDLLNTLNSRYCHSAAAVQLTTSIPGGTYAGPVTQYTDGSYWFVPSTTSVGQHTITYEITDDNGCIQSEEQNIIVDPAVTFSLDVTGGEASFLCSGTTLTFTTGNLAGTAPYTYVWSKSASTTFPYDPFVVISGATTGSYDVTTSGTYRITITDANGCSNTLSGSAIDHLEVTCPGPICPGERPDITITNTGNLLGIFTSNWYTKGVTLQDDVLMTGIPSDGYYYAAAITPSCTLSTRNYADKCIIDVKDAPNPYQISIVGEPGVNHKFLCLGLTEDLTIDNPSVNTNMSNIDVVWSNGYVGTNNVTVPSYTTPPSGTTLFTMDELEDGGYFVVAIDKTTHCRAASNRIHISGPTIDIVRSCGPDPSVILTATTNFPVADNDLQWYEVLTGNVLDPKGTGRSLQVNTAGVYIVKEDEGSCTAQEDLYWGIYENLKRTATSVTNQLSVQDGDFEGLEFCDDLQNQTGRAFDSDFDCKDAVSLPTTPLNLRQGTYLMNFGSNTAHDWNAGWAYTQGRNSSGFMIVDGSTDSDSKRIWYKYDYPVEHGLRYLFKAHITNLELGAQYPPREVPEVYMVLTFRDAAGNGTRYRSRRQSINPNDPWILQNIYREALLKVISNYTPSEVTKVDIEVYMSGGGAIGRDIGLDEVQLIPIGICDDQTELPVSCLTALVNPVGGFSHNVCPGSGTTLSATYIPTLVYEWRAVVNGVVNSSVVGSTNSLVVSSVTEDVVYELTVRDNVNNCSTRMMYYIWKLGVPQVTIATGTGTGCGKFYEATFTGVESPLAVTYQWLVNGTLAATTSAPDVHLPNVNNGDLVTCKVDNVMCGPAISGAVTVSGLSVSASAGADRTVCQGTTTTLGVASTAGFTYSWSPATGLSDATISDPLFTVDPNNLGVAVTYTLTVTNTVDGCSAQDQVILNTQAWPDAPTVTDFPTGVCVGNTASFTIDRLAGFTYSYSTPFTSGVVSIPSGTGTHTVNGLAVGTGTASYIDMYVVDNTTQCERMVSTQYPVNPIPVVTGFAPTAYTCKGGTYPFAVDNHSGSAYNWTVNNGASVNSGQGTAQVDITFPNVGTPVDITIVETSAEGCVSEPYVYNGQSMSPVISIGNDVSICAGQSTSLDGSNYLGSYNWETNPPSEINNMSFYNGPGKPAVTPTQTTVYTLNATVYGCPTSASVTVTVNPNPVQSIVLNTPTGTNEVCTGTYISINFNYLPNQLLSWTQAPMTNQGGGGTPTGFGIGGNITSGGDFTLTTRTALGCTATVTAPVIVNPNATIALTSGTGSNIQTRCSGTSITPITYTIGGGGTGATVSNLPAGVTGTFSAGVFTIEGTPTVSGTFNYTVNTTGTCTQTNATGTITINPIPDDYTFTAAPSPICQGATLTRNLTTPQNGAGVTYAGPTYPAGTVNIGSGGTFTYVQINVSTDFTLTATATVTATGCQRIKTVPITVTPKPAFVPDIVTNTYNCGTNQYTLQAASPVGGTYNFRWYNSPMPIYAVPGNTPLSTNATYSPTINDKASYAVYLQDPITGCFSGSRVAYVQNKCTALQFDGINDLVTLSTPVSTLFSHASTAFSYEVFFSADAGGGNNQSLFSNKSTTANGVTVGLMNGKPYINVNGSTYGGTFGSDLRNGSCHHLAVTRTAPANLMTVYLDGSALFSTGLTTGPSVNNALRFGQDITVAGNAPFKGRLDEVRVWNTALSTGQLTGYSNVSVVPEANLSAVWMFMENTGQNVNERKSTTNKGLCGTNNTVESSDPSWTAYTCATYLRGDEEELETNTEAGLNISVVPNPFDGEGMLNVSGAKSESVGVVITDVTGRIVYENNSFPNNSSMKIGDGLSAEMHFVRIIDGENVKTMKFIKVK